MVHKIKNMPKERSHERHSTHHGEEAFYSDNSYYSSDGEELQQKYQSYKDNASKSEDDISVEQRNETTFVKHKDDYNEVSSSSKLPNTEVPLWQAECLALSVGVVSGVSVTASTPLFAVGKNIY